MKTLFLLQNWVLWLSRAISDPFMRMDATWRRNWECEQGSASARSDDWDEGSGSIAWSALVEVVGVGVRVELKSVAAEWAVGSSAISVTYWWRAVDGRAIALWEVRARWPAVHMASPSAIRVVFNNECCWVGERHRCQGAEDYQETCSEKFFYFTSFLITSNWTYCSYSFELFT